MVPLVGVFGYVAGLLMADKFDKATRSKIMSAIRSANTSPELKVFRELKRRGIYFQRHYKKVIGSLDLAIPSQKIAIFIEGDFWHGFRYPLWKSRLKSAFWKKKIERNRQRDKLYHRKMRQMGWKVMRIWEHQLKNDFEGTVKRIILLLDQQ